MTDEVLDGNVAYDRIGTLLHNLRWLQTALGLYHDRPNLFDITTEPGPLYVATDGYRMHVIGRHVPGLQEANKELSTGHRDREVPWRGPIPSEPGTYVKVDVGFLQQALAGWQPGEDVYLCVSEDDKIIEICGGERWAMVMGMNDNAPSDFWRPPLDP
jgi:hypothetical protein